MDTRRKRGETTVKDRTAPPTMEARKIADLMGRKAPLLMDATGSSLYLILGNGNRDENRRVDTGR